MIVPFNETLPIEKFVKKQLLELAGSNSESTLINKEFRRKCQDLINGNKKVFFTPSCTSALEFAALLIKLQPGDEVVMPSFTFASTANAVLLRGAIPVFVDCDEQTCNITAELIQPAITSRTRAIVVVHYAGVSCDMDEIIRLATEHSLFVIEDSAHAIGAYYKKKRLGSIGNLGTFSFHATKNIICGEGGALLVNDNALINDAEIINEKGTNRAQFLLGEVDKYTWQDVGMSPIMSELCCQYLLPQLQSLDVITQNRLKSWKTYYDGLSGLSSKYGIRLPTIPSYSTHNAHIFFLVLPSKIDRSKFIANVGEKGVQLASHYVPLHNSPAGSRFGKTVGDMTVSNKLRERLVRLPMFYGIDAESQEIVIKRIKSVLKYLSNTTNISTGDL